MAVTDDGREGTSRQLKYKLLKTASLVIYWITAGMFSSLVGTTLVDFKEKLNTDFAHLGTVLVFRTVGVMLGCIISSVLNDRVGIQAELIAGGTAFVVSVINYLKPWSTTIVFFGVLTSLEGACLSSANTINNAIMIRLWGKKAAAPVHALHFGYGLGAFLGPLLASDFLSERCPETDSKTNLTTDNISNFTVLDLQCHNSSEDNPIILKEGRLLIPFTVVGSLLAVISFVFLTFYFLESFAPRFRLAYTAPQEMQSRKEPNKVKTSRSHKQYIWSFVRSFYFRFVIGMFFLYMCITSFEHVVHSFLFTLAYESGTGFSKKEAAYLSSAYFGSYTLSRLVAIIIAHFVTVKIMVFVEMLGTLACFLLMIFWGFSVKTGMWASACLMGIFVGPIWPSGLAFADRYVPVKASVVAATDLGAGIGGSVTSWLAGIFLDNNNGKYFLYVASSGCVIALVLVSALQFVGRRHGDRHDALHDPSINSDEIDPSSVQLRETKSSPSPD